MQRIPYYFLLIIVSSLPFLLTAQSLGSQVFLRGGLSIGSPIIVKNIPEGATGKPGFGPNLGIQWRERFHPNFSLAIGIGYSEKGSQFTSPVTGKYDAARGILGETFPIPIRIKYTGTVDAKIQNNYLDFPIIASVHTARWRFGLGYQYSKLLKGRLAGSVDVKALLLTFNDQAFDESANIQTRENVALLSIERAFSDRISLSFETSVSLGRLMIQEEEGVSNPRNVYAHLLVGYKLFDIARRAVRP